MKHSFNRDHVRYFNKYQVPSKVHQDPADVKRLPKELVIAASIVAYEWNDNEFVPASGPGVMDFSESTNSDGDTISQYVMTKSSNKEIVRDIIHLYSHVITKQHKEAAKSMIANLELAYMMKILKSDLGEFDTGVNSILASDTVHPHNDIGIIAFLPKLANGLKSEELLEDRSANSKHIISGGQNVVVKLAIEIINSRPSQQYGGYNINAITDDGNRVSFYTSKEHFHDQKDWIAISAKVKSHGKVYRSDHIKETRLNYVKLI